MEEHPDNVSNIHNRFSLTLLNPSSHYFSLIASLAIAVVISLPRTSATWATPPLTMSGTASR